MRSGMLTSATTRCFFRRERSQAYVLSGASAFQYLTPFGGLAMMGGWSALAVGALLEPPADEDGCGDGGENAEETARLPR